MAPKQRIAVGAQVETRDGHFGVVEDVLVQPRSGQLIWLMVRHDHDLYMVPADSIVEVVGRNRVRLAGSEDDTLARANAVASAGDEQTVRVPIHEERLHVSTQTVDLGEVRLHRHVDREPEIVTRAVERDELVVERVKLDRLIDAPVSTREEDGWLVVPIMEEVLVVTKQLVLTEEVRIGTRRVVEEQEVYEELRRERIEIEDATVHGIQRLDRPSLDGLRPETTDSAERLSSTESPLDRLESRDPRVTS